VVDDVGIPEAVVPVRVLTTVVVGAVSPEDLQAEASEIDAIAAPPAAMPARCRNCRLENLDTRMEYFFPGVSFFSFSAILTHLSLHYNIN
jgi:hypothetical protein